MAGGAGRPPGGVRIRGFLGNPPRPLDPPPEVRPPATLRGAGLDDCGEPAVAYARRDGFVHWPSRGVEWVVSTSSCDLQAFRRRERCHDNLR